jgi:dienelactone hydrolase
MKWSRAASAMAIALSPLVEGSSATAAVHEWNRALIEVTDLDSLGLSPDGRTLLFRTSKADLERNSYRLTWYQLDAATGAVRTLGPAGEPVFDDPGVLRESTPLWLANGEDAVAAELVEGAIGIWRYSRVGQVFSRLLSGSSNVEKLRLGADDESLEYELGPVREAIAQAEENERDTGIRVDEKVDLAQSLFRGGRVDGRKATQRFSGYWYMRQGLLAAAPRQLHRFNLASGEDRAISAPQWPKPFSPPALDAVASLDAPHGGSVHAFWDGKSGRIEWRPTAAARALACHDPSCSTLRVGWLAWRDPGRELLIGFWDSWHRHRLALWKLPNQRVRTIAVSEGQLAGNRRGWSPCAVSLSAVYCVEASAVSPPRLVRISLADGKRSILFDPNTELRSSYRARAWPRSFALPDGREVSSYLLTQADTPQRAPLFVNYYRCDGFLRGGEGDEWPLPALLEAGFAVLCINAAPFTGPQDAVATYQTGLAAVRAAITELAAENRIDRLKVAMGGFSFGSEVAMWTATKSDLLAAVSIASGQVEPTDYWFGAVMGKTHDDAEREVWGLGPPGTTPERWKLVSPAFNTDRIKVPVLLQLPEQEARRIPELFVRLRGRGTPVEFYAYPDEAHLKIEPRHRLWVYERNLDWLRYWLQDRRDPGPDKLEQYRRWDAMRASARAANRTPRP